MSFQEDEVGAFSTFSFHKCRDNEYVDDIDNLEDYSQPIYLEMIKPNSSKSNQKLFK
ncbi:hypothetical protein LU293_00015 [Moraxella nasovis]|uniref:hypothetical protein n=1 Tax=Moraxella nasovis TaxID=2904121 RepID=UPI001F6023C2|nr:hypothetical protein [Moraxella nasovis]UNU73338.1 hypothetical protein LU293_00015 [Moraxella nasovis]